MKKNDFNQYDFENPHWLEKLVDKTIMKYFAWFFYRHFLSFINIEGDENILDFGSGSGNLAKCVLKNINDEGSLICLEPSNYWSNLAKKRLKDYKKVDFINDDIRRAEIQNDNFDIIYIYYVIHDINPQARQEIVEVIAKKLKKDGKLYIKEPTKESHGMKKEEIINLMKKFNLKLEKSIENKSSFHGEFSNVKN